MGNLKHVPNRIFRNNVLFSQGHRSFFTLFVCGSGSGSGSGSRGKEAEAEAVDGLAASTSLVLTHQVKLYFDEGENKKTARRLISCCYGVFYCALSAIDYNQTCNIAIIRFCTTIS